MESLGQAREGASVEWRVMLCCGEGDAVCMNSGGRLSSEVAIPQAAGALRRFPAGTGGVQTVFPDGHCGGHDAPGLGGGEG